MKTKAEKLLERMSILYQNIYNLVNVSNLASQTNAGNITIELTDPDTGEKKVTNIKSFQELQNEITRIDNNFKSLISEPSYILESDGTIAKYNRVSFLNAEFINNINFDGNKCVIDNTSFVEDMVYPTIKLPIEISSNFTNIRNNQIYAHIYDVSEGFDMIPEDVKELNLQYLNEQGHLFYSVYNRTLDLRKQQVNYYGSFTVEEVTIHQSLTNTYCCTLDKLSYTSRYTIGDSIELKIGDYVVNANGTTKYQIIDIDRLNRQIQITRVAGVEVPKIGQNNLVFNEVITTDTNIVEIPIKPNKKLVVFLSVTNDTTISYPTAGIKIDTTDFKVQHDGTTYSIDEYFQKFVTNFSQYLYNIIRDTTIPYTLGIKPNKPVLDARNFKVIQINKHLIDAKTQSELTNQNKKKQQVQNEIDYKQSQIDKIQNEIDTLKYNSIAEKNYQLDKIVTLRNEIVTLKANMLSITRDIDSNATKFGLKDSKPKYKLLGFWDIQDDIYSPLTQPQHIIMYDVQYRYLSKDVDVADATTYKMISNGNEVTVAFSNWNEYKSTTLTKVGDINGNLKWEQPIVDSVDDININQCAITISEGESIEVRVRAVSEAGYPISPMKSEWSEPLRIDFPDTLKNNNLQATVSQNDIDLSKAEFNEILRTLGLLSHVSGTIKESEKTFYHPASDIASGQYTAEQKNIPLDVCIKNILNDINILKQTDTSQNIVISFIDFDNEVYAVENNSTLEISAGTYSTVYNALNQENWGGIVRKKGYIKIRNNNNIPIEFRTLVPGTTIDATNAEEYYNTPVIVGDSNVQAAKQILYFRNKDLTGGTGDNFLLVKEPQPVDNTYPNSGMIDNNAKDSDKNIVYYQNGTVKKCKLIDTYTNTDFIAYTTEHPMFNVDDMQTMVSEFQRLKMYNSNLKAAQYQSAAEPNDVNIIGFQENDKYMIGRNSCGACLYPLINKPSSIQVNGNTTVSTLIIPKESEILIPIIFEYRMTDRLGNVNGIKKFATNLTYNKKMGVDLLINGSVFRFDLSVNAQYKTRITSIYDRNLSSIAGNFNAESKEILY